MLKEDWETVSKNECARILFEEFIANSHALVSPFGAYSGLKALRIEGNKYYATIHYKAQDHFGIDKTDIMDWRFHQFKFFQIWFVLQRYNKFGYKPFLTNMQATIEISGDRT